MSVYALNGIEPVIEDSATSWVADSADIIGRVTLARYSSVWFGAILRGDNEMIVIGEGSNIQDLAVVHTDEGIDVSVGRDCTIGHRAIIHGCVIADRCLIGMGAIIMNHVEIGTGSIVGAGTIVTQGKIFPPNSLVLGSPARLVRELNDDEIAGIAASAFRYRENAMRFKRGLLPIS